MLSQYSYLLQPALYLSGEISNLDFDEANLAGARKSGKTYGIDEALGIALGAAIQHRKKIAIYGFRKWSGDTEQMKKDFSQTLDQLGFVESSSKLAIKNGHYKYSEKKGRPHYEFVGGSFIEFIGVYKSSTGAISLKGLARADNFDMSITWREEANEISNKEKQAIDYAVRGAKKHLTLSSTNPDNIYQPHITYLHENVPFNRQTLEEHGEQFNVVKSSGLKKIFHYTNFRINPHLEPWELALFDELKKMDPFKYEVWGLGMPGGVETSMFSRYMKSIERTFTPRHYVGGLDLGMASSPTGHPTSAMFISMNDRKDHFFPEDEFYWSNATMAHKDTYAMAESIIMFYRKQLSHVPNLIYGFTCFVDHGAGGAFMIDVLNEVKAKYNCNWINFVAVKKEVWFIKDRADITIVLLTRNQLQINKEKTPWLYKTMNLMEWKKPSETAFKYKLEALDANDDGWDSLMYAIMQYAQNAVSSQQNQLLINKRLYNKTEASLLEADDKQW